MTTTEYLYGVKIEHFNVMLDKVATEKRLKLAHEMIKHLHKPKFMHRDDRRIRAVYKAIKHNEERMEEYAS